MKVFKIKNELDLFNIKKAIAITRFDDTEFRLAFIKNSQVHNEKHFAYFIINKKYKSKKKFHFFDGSHYIVNDYLSILSWKKKVKQIKRQNKLKVFK